MKNIARTLFSLLAALSLVSAAHVFAGSATWKANPTSNDWNVAANWTPATVPNDPSDVATFATSSTTQVFITADSADVDRIAFDPGADAFTITRRLHFFGIDGAGVINNSGITQTIVAADGGSIAFRNMARRGRTRCSSFSRKRGVFALFRFFQCGPRHLYFSHQQGWLARLLVLPRFFHRS